MPWTLEAAVCAISLVASFNPSGCARLGIAGLSAHRGGSASPWVESPSEAVLSVSSPFSKRGGRKNSCRPNSLEPKFSLPVSGLFLAVNEAHVGFLIKNDGIPAPLRERKNPTNASESVRSVVPGAALTMRPLALAFKIRFGRSLWKSLHRMADGWPCARCRPEMTIWMQGLHDAVNVRLGKRPFRPDSYAQYASGSLERGFHSGCLGCRAARAGSRFLARAPRPQIQTP